MEIAKIRTERRFSKAHSIRRRIHGTAERPRLCVRRTLKHLIAQVIDDLSGKSIAQIHSKALGLKNKKTDVAKAVGKAVAEKLKSLGIDKVVFDRSGYVYHGRVRALAESARENGLKF